jgi:ABC-type oligopeptide transport system substrate-binding subunit
VDDRTLVVELEDPSSDLLYNVTDAWTVAVPRHAVRAHGRAWAEPDRLVTSGPFRLVDLERGRSAVYERNPSYYGRFTGNLERVETVFGTQEQHIHALNLYEQDRLDVLELGIEDLTEWNRARQRYAAEHVSRPTRTVVIVGLNVSRPPLDDRRVRRALVMAIDREAWAAVAFGGRSFPATGGLWPPGTAAHSPGIGLPYDPEGARCLLAEAGYPGGRGFPQLEALGWEQIGFTDIDEFPQQQWLENLGIDIPCRLVPWHEYLERLTPRRSVDRPAMWYGVIGIGAGRDDQVYGDLEQEGFTAGWQNEAYRRLEEANRHAEDPQERLRICQAADRILVNEAPTIILNYQRRGFLIKPWVTRFPLSATAGRWWKDVVIEPH